MEQEEIREIQCELDREDTGAEEGKGARSFQHFVT